MSRTVVSYGMGTNSTAMLVGLRERGERPDFIASADTMGEKPHTYEHLQVMRDWCAKVGFPDIISVSEGDLEADCLRRNALPAIAYGWRTCSQRFKIRPIERLLKEMGGEWITLIGFDADEPQRAKDIPGNRYPLIEWDWGRQECIEAIARAGLPQPGKSACFFCPNSKPHEVIELKRRYPELMDRALALESGAKLTEIKGLGISYAWRDLLKWDADQMKLFDADTAEMPCGCYDGE